MIWSCQLGHVNVSWWRALMLFLLQRWRGKRRTTLQDLFSFPLVRACMIYTREALSVTLFKWHFSFMGLDAAHNTLVYECRTSSHLPTLGVWKNDNYCFLHLISSMLFTLVSGARVQLLCSHPFLNVKEKCNFPSSYLAQFEGMLIRQESVLFRLWGCNGKIRGGILHK